MYEAKLLDVANGKALKNKQIGISDKFTYPAKQASLETINKRAFV